MGYVFRRQDPGPEGWVLGRRVKRRISRFGRSSGVYVKFWRAQCGGMGVESIMNLW